MINLTFAVLQPILGFCKFSVQKIIFNHWSIKTSNFGKADGFGVAVFSMEMESFCNTLCRKTFFLGCFVRKPAKRNGNWRGDYLALGDKQSFDIIPRKEDVFFCGRMELRN